MEIGIIAPIKMLEECCITGIQYCLPKLIVESEEYRKFYKGRIDEGDKVYMDLRQIGWRRGPEEWPIVEKALATLRPTYVILPSFAFEKEKTVQIEEDYSKRLEGFKLIGTPEGTTLSEVNECMKALGLGRWALPSHLYSLIPDKQLNGYYYIDNHLYMGELKGWDGTLFTSLPVRLGLKGRILSDYRPSIPALTFYEEPQFPKIVDRNIREALEYYK